MAEGRGIVNQHGYSSSSLMFTHFRPALAEFLGTTFFIFLGTMVTINSNNLVAIALAHALGLAVLVAAMANISGSHFNPAVTFGVCLAGEISFVKAVLYVISQVLGGILGAAMTRLVLPKTLYIAAQGGGQTLSNGVSAGEGIACEIFLTAILVMVILMTAVDSDSKVGWAPLAIGFTVGADILAGGQISAASMNPARSFGPAVVASQVDGIGGLWNYHYIYWVGPAVGACFSVFWYRLLFACPERNILFRVFG